MLQGLVILLCYPALFFCVSTFFIALCYRCLRTCMTSLKLLCIALMELLKGATNRKCKWAQTRPKTYWSVEITDDVYSLTAQSYKTWHPVKLTVECILGVGFGKLLRTLTSLKLSVIPRYLSNNFRSKQQKTQVECNKKWHFYSVFSPQFHIACLYVVEDGPHAFNRSVSADRLFFLTILVSSTCQKALSLPNASYIWFPHYPVVIENLPSVAWNFMLKAGMLCPFPEDTFFRMHSATRLRPCNCFSCLYCAQFTNSYGMQTLLKLFCFLF